MRRKSEQSRFIRLWSKSIGEHAAVYKSKRLALISILPLLLLHQPAQADEAFRQFKLGIHQAATDNFRSALPYLSRAVKLNPKERSYFLSRAMCRTELQDFAGAEADCAAALKLDPKCGGAYSRRGYARLMSRKYLEGISDLDMALKLNTVEPEIWSSWLDYVNRAKALEITRQYQRSADIKYKDVFQHGERAEISREHLNLKEALKDMQEVVKANPNMLGSRIVRGIMYLNDGNNVKSIEDFNFVINRAPKSMPAYYFRADAYDRLNQPAKALKDYSSIIAAQPQVVAVDYTAETGRCKGEQKHYDDNPVSLADIYALRAQVYRSMKKSDLAFNDINKALQLEPNDADALGSRAAMLGEKGDVEAAMKDLTRAIALAPDQWELIETRSNLYEKSGKPDKAIEDLNKIIELNPEESGSYLLRGRLYDRLKKYDLALEDFNRVLKDSMDEVALSGRAEIYFKLAKYDKALSDCSKAISLDPEGSGHLYDLRSRIHEKLGKPDLAKKDKESAAKWTKAPVAKKR